MLPMVPVASPVVQVTRALLPRASAMATGDAATVSNHLSIGRDELAFDARHLFRWDQGAFTLVRAISALRLVIYADRAAYSALEPARQCTRCGSDLALGVPRRRFLASSKVCLARLAARTALPPTRPEQRLVRALIPASRQPPPQSLPADYDARAQRRPRGRASATRIPTAHPLGAVARTRAFYR